MPFHPLTLNSNGYIIHALAVNIPKMHVCYPFQKSSLLLFAYIKTNTDTVVRHRGNNLLFIHCEEYFTSYKNINVDLVPGVKIELRNI